GGRGHGSGEVVEAGGAAPAEVDRSGDVGVEEGEGRTDEVADVNPVAGAVAAAPDLERVVAPSGPLDERGERVAGRLVFAVPGERARDEDAAAFGFGVGGELLPRQLRPPVGSVGFLHVGEVDVLFVQAPYRAGLLKRDRVCGTAAEEDGSRGAGPDQPAHVPGVEGKVGADSERAAVDGRPAADDRRTVDREIEAGVVAAE